MTDSKKIEILEEAISSFEVYKNGIKDGNVKNFESLKDKILGVLTENEKIRFSQIQFYSEKDEFYDRISDDDLPF